MQTRAFNMPDCEFLSNCGFFRKWSNTNELACKGFIRKYCRGEKHSECKRKKYRAETGMIPPDDMLPNGYMLINGSPSRMTMTNFARIKKN